MRRQILPWRTYWAIAFQPLLVSVWVLLIALPSWSKSLKAKQLVDYSPQAIAYIFAIHAIIVLVPV